MARDDYHVIIYQILAYLFLNKAKRFLKDVKEVTPFI